MITPQPGSIPPPPPSASFPEPKAKNQSPWLIGLGAISFAVALVLGFFVLKLTLFLASLFVIHDVEAGEPIKLDDNQGYVILEPASPEADEVVVRHESGELIEVRTKDEYSAGPSFSPGEGTVTFDRPVSISKTGLGGFFGLFLIFAVIGWLITAVFAILGALGLKAGLNRKAPAINDRRGFGNA